MRYFKTILFLLFILTCVSKNNAFAFFGTRWETSSVIDCTCWSGQECPKCISDSPDDVKIDLASINIHNDSLYYAIQYKKKNDYGYLVSIIQSKGSEAGVVESYSAAEYDSMMQQGKIYPPATSKTAKEFHKLTPESKLYNANLKAMAKSGFKGTTSSSTSTSTTANLGNSNSTADTTPGQPNWGLYMSDMQKRIKRNWHPPKTNTSKHVIVAFTIGKDGKLLSSKIKQSSGIAKVDKAALDAIKLTAPFRPLPFEFKENSVPIEFTFDYNVINR